MRMSPKSEALTSIAQIVLRAQGGWPLVTVPGIVHEVLRANVVLHINAEPWECTAACCELARRADVVMP
jgi:hypothetical protein